jgi:hypothetical protein
VDPDPAKTLGFKTGLKPFKKMDQDLDSAFLKMQFRMHNPGF